MQMLRCSSFSHYSQPISRQDSPLYGFPSTCIPASSTDARLVWLLSLAAVFCFGTDQCRKIDSAFLHYAFA